MDANTKKKLIKLAVCSAIAVIIGILPPPAGLESVQMRYLAVLAWTILTMATKTFPEHICILFGLVALVFFKVGTINEVLSAFGQGTAWLLVGVLGFAAGLSKTKLLRRITLHIMKLFPATYTGQLSALTASGLVLAPLVPNVYAKYTILGPLAVDISENNGYKKGTKPAIAMFLMYYLLGGIVGTGFFSGSANAAFFNGLIKDTGVQFDFFSYLQATFMWIIVLVVGMFLICMFLFRPKATESTVTQKPDYESLLRELGPMDKEEKIAGIIALGTIVMWMTSSIHGIDATTVALTACGLMFATGILAPADFNGKIGWSTMFLIIGMLNIANFFSSLGISTYVTEKLGPVFQPIASNIYLSIILMCALTFIIRYVVISTTTTRLMIFMIFSPLMAQFGVNGFVAIFVPTVMCVCWQTTFNNINTMFALKAVDYKLCEYKDITFAAYIFFVVCTLGCLACVPVWRMMGLV